MPLLSATSLPSFSSLTSYLLTNNPLYKNQTSRTILFAIGAGIVLSKLFNTAKGLVSLFPIPKDLAARYGKGSWAVVTGASDGIGRGFALELASRGFNIVLVSRTQDRMESVAQEIKTRHPEIQTRIVVADFVKAAEEGFAESIYEQVKDLDISILVNNAGMGLGIKFYTESEVEKIKDLIVVNSLSHALILRTFLPHLANRTQKSAIINVSSLTAAAPLPKNQVYGASKAFLDYLSRGLAYEHPNIDILSFKPGFVSTKMINSRKPDGETITVEQSVQSALSELGHTDNSFGHWKHKKVSFMIASMPSFLFKAMIKKRFKLGQNQKPAKLEN